MAIKPKSRTQIAVVGGFLWMLVGFGQNDVALGWQDVSTTTFDTAIQPGLDQITEGRVTSTISFLASDELAGRATGSIEFNIAAGYVASRFRGAGLEGGVSDGVYYHETMRRMIQTSADGLKLEDADAKSRPQLGLLAGAASPLSWSGSPTIIDLSKELPRSDLDGVCIGSYSGDAKGNRLLSQIARMTVALKAAGASGLLLGVSPESELIGMAKEARAKLRLENARDCVIPVLLVPEGEISSSKIKVEIPANLVSESPMRNVVGVLRGSDPELSKEAILFSAHLDHLGTKLGMGDGIFNGADDDATGVTGVLTLADAFAAMTKPKRSLLFMTFWGEESGLLGSKQYVEKPTWPLEKIVANVNIEMIGRPEPGAGGKIWMTGWQQSDLGRLMNNASKPFGVEIFNHPKYSSMLYGASDNASFAQKGVIAHSFSAGSLHSDYHQPDDEWERLEIPHMTRVIQGLFVASIPLASGEATPHKGTP